MAGAPRGTVAFEVSNHISSATHHDPRRHSLISSGPCSEGPWAKHVRSVESVELARSKLRGIKSQDRRPDAPCRGE